MDQSTALLCFTTLPSSLPFVLFSDCHTGKSSCAQTASSLEEGALPFIKQASEQLFADQMFQSSSLGRGFLTPGQLCSQHAAATR